MWRELGLRAVTLCSLLVGHNPSESRMVRRHVITLLCMVSFIVLPLSPKRGTTQIEDEHGGNDGDDHEEEDDIRSR